ncbi:MAG: hypothetical protein V1649_01945 [Patescibacteria group bacterium]
MEKGYLITPKQLINEIKKVLDVLHTDSPHLFLADMHETALVHQVACVLNKCQFLSGYSIDLEYNRITGINSDQVIKKTFKEDAGDLFRPDLIIHIPRTQLANLLVIEFSKEKDTKREEDKLKELTKRDGKYGYRIGILIDLPKYESWKFFINGESFDYKRAIYLLDEFGKLADEAFNSFYNINLNYQVGNENLEESQRQVGTVMNSDNDLEWDKASNIAEEIYERNKEALSIDCENFKSNFKEYFQLVFIPEYFRCSEIIENLYKITLRDSDERYPNAVLKSDSWFQYPEEAFELIHKLCLYCHYSLEGDSKKQKVLSELEEGLNFFNNLDGSLDF